MLFGKSRVNAHLIAAVLSVATALAQSAAPKREPDVPYVPTTEAAVQAMLKLGEVKKTDVVYDLGCGDGRIVIAAAKSYGARGVGIDINPVRINEAKENARKATMLRRHFTPSTSSNHSISRLRYLRSLSAPAVG